MPAELLWTPQALDDLLEIYLLLALESERAAERVFAALTRRAAGLCDVPRLGPRRPDLAPTARMLVEGRYLLLYEVHPDEDSEPAFAVEVVRIVDGRRELSGAWSRSLSVL